MKQEKCDSCKRYVVSFLILLIDLYFSLFHIKFLSLEIFILIYIYIYFIFTKLQI